MEDSTPGSRVREVRKRQGLNQRQLAAKANLSLSTVKKIEQSHYGPVRLPVRRKLAAALGITVTDLDARPDPPVPHPQDAPQWQPVQAAIAGQHVGQLESEPDLDGLSDDLGHALNLLLGSEFGALAEAVPLLLAEADALVASSVNGQQVKARALRAQIRQVAGSLMLHTWQFDAAEEAFAAAIADAPDELTAMAVVDERSWGLIRQGRLAETQDTAHQWAADHEPKMTAGPDELAAYGRLMTRAAMAAVRDNRPDEAAEALRLARMAAAGIGRDIIVPHAPWHVFGPVTVSVFAAESAMILEQPERVLAIGRRLAGTRPAMPLPRFAPSFQLDIAHAHAMLHNDDDAVAVLQELRAARPQWLPRQRYAADILDVLFAHRRTLSRDMQELAEAVRLPL
jgi:transcriptional regulator with XRE-family HTH domain